MQRDFVGALFFAGRTACSSFHEDFSEDDFSGYRRDVGIFHLYGCQPVSLRNTKIKGKIGEDEIMNRRDVERCLSRFKISEPGPDLRDKVLLKARAVWEENGETIPVHIYSFRLLKNCAYALAGVILLSVVALNVKKPMTGKLPGSELAISKHIEKESETKIFSAAKNTTQVVKNERRVVKSKPGPEIVKHFENDAK